MMISRMLQAMTVTLGYAGVSLSVTFAQTTGQHPVDTLSFDQRCIVFYTPSAAQRTTYSKSRLPTLDSLSKKFDRTIRSIVPFLRKVGITSVTSEKMVFRFGHGDTTVLCQRKSRDLFGVIMFSPGKAPMMVRGVQTDVDLFKSIFPYFGIR
jgi:hypothetical protein